MKRKQRSRRLVGGILAIGLTVFGLSPASGAPAGARPDPAADSGIGATAVNLAAGKPTSASSSQPGYPPANATDGNRETYWESGNNAFPQWLQVDLGAAVAVNRVVLRLPGGWGARTQAVAVQGSTNGTAFTDLSPSAARVFDPAAGNTATIDFTARDTRYVRLHVTANTGWPAGQVAELEVHGPETGDVRPPSPPGDLTLTEPAAGQIRLAWSASSDDTGVTGYTVYANGAERASVPGATLTYTDSRPATDTVTYTVRARDAAGNVSGDSNPVTRVGRGGGGTDLARGKPIEASSSVFSFVAANANDGDVATYWEAGGQSSTLTVKLGANADVDRVVVRLNPDPVWGPRTQSFQVLGREQSATGFTSLVARADHAFSPTGNQNTVTVPVGARVADVRLQFFGNTGAPGGQVAELQVVGVAAPNPDLTVTSLTWSPAAPTEVDAVTLTAAVRNAGSAAAPATTVDFSVGGAVVGSASVAALAAGASAAVSFPAGRRPMGSHQVKAVVDPTNAVVERDDANNTHTAPSPLVVTQAPGPDLLVADVVTNPPNPAVGATVSFTASVRNRGTSGVGAGSVTRLVVGGATLDTTTPAVAAGATVTVPVTGTWRATAGGATITATADATGAVAETDEANNTWSRSIVVGPGAARPLVQHHAVAAPEPGPQSLINKSTGPPNFLCLYGWGRGR
ncbi:CARDB domain-containing protein, partial [Actinosynnema sp. NPDC059335]|uniref:CARDB domain-containing protein n=1 Tax=Actinosynnema sp. NPDC059335 TaxID=3346804 RepID=UPI00366F8A0F